MRVHTHTAGTLAGRQCTTIRLEPNPFSGVAPEEAAAALAELLRREPATGHNDEAGATVVSVSETHEAPWLCALAAAAAIADAECIHAAAPMRSVWVASDNVRESIAVCVYSGGTLTCTGERAAYRDGLDK